MEPSAAEKAGRFSNGWITTSNVPNKKLRLFCLPYAGGGTGTYRNWQKAVRAGIEVCPVRLPGREMRIKDKPIEERGMMVQSIIAALTPVLAQPYALFGHSMGGLLAYLVACEIRDRRLPLPRHLFVSARPAPQIVRSVLSKPVSKLSDAEFLQELAGTVNSSLMDFIAESELLAVVLPALRSDFQLLEGYSYVPREPLPLPITALGGISDPTVSETDLQPWAECTTAAFSLEMLEGDHFFVNNPGLAIKVINSKLEALLYGLSPIR
jgi:medium-chain acyl-[acyl-carrier-protein] hydrolase